MDEEKKIILFGAGQIGKKALSYFGREKIHCFVDNNAKLEGSTIDGVSIVSFDTLRKIYPDYQIIISMDVAKSMVVAAQLEEAGINQYTLFMQILPSAQGWLAATSKTDSSISKHVQCGKRILMIAYYFPPMSGSGVFRSLKFAKYLPQFGWKPVVFSADRPKSDWSYTDQSLMDEIPDCADVIRITDPVGTMQKLTLLDEKDVLLPFLHDILKKDQEAEEIFFSFLQDKTGMMDILVFPGAELLWAHQVIRYIEENMDIQQIQGVYTTSAPDSSHLVGYYLKKKYGLSWVADYRDPWTANPEPALDLEQPRGRLIRRLEQILLEQADCNITVSEELVQDYVQRLGLPENKIVSITNGYDEADFEGLALPIKRESRFTINYSGILYTKRSIDTILEALQQLVEEGQIDPAKIRFRIVGESREYNPKAIAKRFGLENIITETGYVSHKQALQLNLESNLLLLLVGDDEKYKVTYTGKVFDYLRSGRPILAFAPKNGAVDRVLRETGHGEAYLSTQIPEIKTMILREYNRWKSGQPVPLLHSPAIERFERKALTRQLADILDRNGKKRKRGVEFSNRVYNECYKSGGAGGGYHKHYTKSGYYLSWQTAMSYLEGFDISGSILEIGCGVGQFANMLFDHGFTNYVGFDFAEEAVKRAKQTNTAFADRFVVADAFETELLEKHYDLVICFEVLEHLNKDLELLGRIRPGTRLLLSVPNFDDTYHVRCFGNEAEVQARYGHIMKIEDIKRSLLSLDTWLYYIWGEKL